MNQLLVNLKENKYRIVIGDKILPFLGKFIRNLNIGQDALIITNPLIKKTYGQVVKKSLEKYNFSSKFLTIPDTEKAKSIKEAISLCKQIANYDKYKRVFIIALGGGVVGDVAGFVASIYKRGIPYIQIPTTLLSQVDSSIGGKTGVDLKIAKNLIGSFYQPRLVFSDISCLETLFMRDIKSGLSEIIKYALICDKKLFVYLEKNLANILKLQKTHLEKIIFRCSQIKARIVEIDEKEKMGIRTILNFGHTLGHAIEAASGYTRYNHGEAIAIGMVISTKISQRLGFITTKEVNRIQGLISKVGLPVRICAGKKKLNINTILQSFSRDKKFIKGKNRFVLLKNIGKAFVKEDIPIEIIKEALI